MNLYNTSQPATRTHTYNHFHTHTHSVEVARWLATHRLRAQLLQTATAASASSDPDSDDDTPTSSNPALDRAFHRWLRASKTLHDPPLPSPAAAADPVLPSRPACQRDLPLAQALITAGGLSVEAAAEACEALGTASIAAATAIGAGRYDGEDLGAGVGARREKGGSTLLAAVADPTEAVLHPLSRLEQPPVLRSRHHRPCLYLPLSAPGLGERLAGLEVGRCGWVDGLVARSDVVTSLC